MLFISNFIWTKNKPKGYDASDENKILGIFERIAPFVFVAAIIGIVITYRKK